MVTRIVVGSDGSEHAQHAVAFAADLALWLADVAREVDARFIVVGNRGLHALGELFLGSTSHSLTHETTVPLIVVPGAHVHRTRRDGAKLTVLGGSSR